MRRTKNMDPNDSSGQAMILMTVMLGGLILSVTAVAGLLMFYQLRQVNDAASSGMAVFAADAGLEAGLNCYYHEVVVSAGKPLPGKKDYCPKSGSLSPNVTYSSSIEFTFDPSDPTKTKVTGFILNSFGFAGQTERAVQNTFSNQL